MTSADADALLDLAESRGIEMWAEGARLRFRAPEGAMTEELRTQLGVNRAAILARWRIRATARRTSAPLSWTQLGLWLVHNTQPDSAAYHVCSSAHIISVLDVNALRDALQALVDRHESLRTIYVMNGAEPAQVVLGHQPVDFELVAVAALDDAALHALLRRDYERPFDLITGPVLRARLYVRGDQDAVLLIVWHHIAIDGWSVWILLDELGALYEAHATGRSAGLPRAEVQYRAFAEWQREFIASERGEALWAFWKQQLAGAEPLPRISDWPHVFSTAPAGGSLSGTLSATRVEGLKRIAAAGQTTFFVVLLATFKVLLYRYTRHTDIIVGTPTFGRSRPQFRDLVGDLVNTVPLRTDLGGDPSFRELVSRVRQTTLEALQHADYPFALLAQRLSTRRDAGRAPLVDVLFNLQTPHRVRGLTGLMFPTADSDLQAESGGLTLKAFPIAQQEGQFDLVLESIERDGHLHMLFKYRSDLFERSTIERMLADWLAIVDIVAVTPDIGLTSLAAASEDEERQILAWNDTAQLVPEPLTLHGLFERQASASPDATAVADADTSLTYAELDRLASAVAASLHQRGVGPGTRVGVAVERSSRMVAALLGILKTGAAYVPIDPSYPPERIAHVLADAELAAVLTERSIAGDRPTAHGPAVVYMEDILQPMGTPTDLPAGSPDAPAYVIYTSGSTGGPKGVVVHHRAAASMLAAFRERFGLSRRDRWVALTTLSFDISVLEVFGTLATGASMFVASRADAADGVALTEILKTWQPTCVQATPSTWQLLLDADWQGTDTLTIIVGGEALSNDLASRLIPRCARLFNAYGPTETTVWATVAHVVDASRPMTIGRPLANVRTYVLDGQCRLLPLGVPGELWIGGAGVALGYYRREALTSERFVPDPFWPDGRMYRTGDLARWRHTGEIEFLGRVDHQIKLRGHRIELGEIENALERHPLVRQAVVSVQEVGASPQLVGYLLPAGQLAFGDIRRFLRDSLPDYMIPAFFQLVESFPMTTSGKVDRRRLPPVVVDDQRAIEPPGTVVEATLLKLWQELLGFERISVTDNFFDLGGHSLLAMKVCARIAEVTGRRPHVSVLLQAPTIAELAARLESNGGVHDRLLVPFRSQGSGLPYFCVPGAGDNAFIFADLARHLGADRRVFSFKFPEQDDATGMSVRQRVGEIASRLLDELRTVQGAGPYLLGGYCLGGLVAFEMARLLEASGESVAALTIFETYLPGGLRMPQLRERVAHQLRYMKELPWHEQLGFVARMTGRRLARTSRRVAPAMGAAIAPLVTTDDDYTPRRAVGCDLTLFRGRDGTDGLVLDREMGWSGLASRIMLHEIGGHHTNAYKEPFVSSWIDSLRQTLKHAEGAFQPTGPSQVKA